MENLKNKIQLTVTSRTYQLVDQGESIEDMAEHTTEMLQR